MKDSGIIVTLSLQLHISQMTVLTKIVEFWHFLDIFWQHKICHFCPKVPDALSVQAEIARVFGKMFMSFCFWIIAIKSLD